MKRSDTKIRKMLGDTKTTRAEKYQSLIIGRSGLWELLKFEFVVLCCSWLPGVAGLFFRSRLYPLLLGSVGRNVVFGTNVVLRHAHKIHIGNDVVIDDNCLLDAKGSDNKGILLGDRVFIGRNSILSCKDGSITLEDGVNIGFNCEIFSSGEVRVGKNTLIAAYTYLIGGGNYALDREDVSFAEQEGLESRGGITIDAGSWIGAGVIVLDGVHIGAASVIGAGTVVTDDIPSNSVAAGVPAKVLRTRKTSTDLVRSAIQ